MVIYKTEKAQSMCEKLGQFDWIDICYYFRFKHISDAEEYLRSNCVEVRNLTSHTVYLEINCEMVAIAPSGTIARAISRTEEVGNLGGIRLTRTVFGLPIDLPDPSNGIYLVVNAVTARAAKAAGRSTDDLLLPAEPIRDEQGRIVGCRSLSVV
jgi:hypothetical protein